MLQWLHKGGVCAGEKNNWLEMTHTHHGWNKHLCECGGLVQWNDGMTHKEKYEMFWRHLATCETFVSHSKTKLAGHPYPGSFGITNTQWSPPKSKPLINSRCNGSSPSLPVQKNSATRNVHPNSALLWCVLPFVVLFALVLFRLCETVWTVPTNDWGIVIDHVVTSACAFIPRSEGPRYFSFETKSHRQKLKQKKEQKEEKNGRKTQTAHDS